MASYESQVQQARSPQEALLVIARGLDALVKLIGDKPQDGWSVAKWDSPANHEVLHEFFSTAREMTTLPERRTEVVTTGREGDAAEVVVPPPTPERLEARRGFEALHLKLGDSLGDDPPDTTWNEAYAKGGPMWLYLGNRDFVMSLPPQIKAALIDDVRIDSVQDADEMGRDILKHPAESGPGHVGMRMADG